MGAATWAIEEMRFVGLNADLTKVYVRVSATGDSPIQVPGWYTRAFAPDVSVMDILSSMQHESILSWDRGAPPT